MARAKRESKLARCAAVRNGLFETSVIDKMPTNLL